MKRQVFRKEENEKLNFFLGVNFFQIEGIYVEAALAKSECVQLKIWFFTTEYE
jgi:hypothetical protein